MLAAKPAFLTSSFLPPFFFFAFCSAFFSSAIVRPLLRSAVVDPACRSVLLEPRKHRRAPCFGPSCMPPARPHLGWAKGAHTCPNPTPSQSGRRSSCRTASSSRPRPGRPRGSACRTWRTPPGRPSQGDGAGLLDDAALGVLRSVLLARAASPGAGPRPSRARRRGRSSGPCRAWSPGSSPSARRPAMTCTVSPTFSFCMASSPGCSPSGLRLEHLGRERDDLHELAGAELAGHRPEDARADGLHVLVDEDRGVAVELDVAAVRRGPPRAWCAR